MHFTGGEFIPYALQAPHNAKHELQGELLGYCHSGKLLLNVQAY